MTEPFDIKKYRPNFIKEALGETSDSKPRKCLKCPTMLKPWIKWYCSGECMNRAKADLTYGMEAHPHPTK